MINEIKTPTKIYPQKDKIQIKCTLFNQTYLHQKSINVRHTCKQCE